MCSQDPACQEIWPLRINPQQLACFTAICCMCTASMTYAQDVPGGSNGDQASQVSSQSSDETDLEIAEDDIFAEGQGNIYALLDLEQLMQIQVSSVTGVRTSLFRSPAALTVLTADDIRRAGHRSIPEALRLVPGMHVARLDSSTWAISARGFTSEFANKLQVLQDGRRLYDPFFSGVFWDVQDTIIEDIDQIEVIRGPGATLWGANAVNGVINITTKPASETQGVLLTGGGGTFERGFGAVRYGGRISDDAHFRVYGKYRNFNNTPSVDAGRRPDEWDTWQTGFRLDFSGTAENQFTIQGDAFHLPERGTRRLIADPAGHFQYVPNVGKERATGGNVMTRWQHDGGNDSHWTIQFYYDRIDRASSDGFRFTRDSFDLDLRHRFSLGDRHEIIWGLNFRHDRLDTEPTAAFSMVPDARSIDTFSGFIQDTITIVPDRLFGMVGTKLEHNDFSGFEIQPSARLWWTPDEKQTLWAAVSRPVRTPSWVEQDMLLRFAYADPGLLMEPPFPTGMTIPIFITGNRDVGSEKMLAWEAGYRRKVTDTLTIDVAGFYNRYSDLIDLDEAAFAFANVGRADVYGLELAAQWRLADNWRLLGSYSFLNIETGDSFTAPGWAGSSPRHQFQIHSRLDITDDLEFNSGLYFVDNLRAQRTGDYFRLDLGLTWRPRHNVELSVWGQNLLESRHVEFDSAVFSLDSPAMIERSVAVQATIRF